MKVLKRIVVSSVGFALLLVWKAHLLALHFLEGKQFALDGHQFEGLPNDKVATLPKWSCMAQNELEQAKNLLGIMLVGKADVYTIKQWMHRHHRLFERLVVIDGSNSSFVEETLSMYPHTVRLDERDLNITNITDQTLRAPAMTVLGNPVGCWIMICHADEYWVVDPREMLKAVVQEETKVNLVAVSVMTASPMESTHRRISHPINVSTFDIMSVSTFTRGTISRYFTHWENRFVRWENGMHFGTRHGLTVPEFFPFETNRKKVDSFHVHFKLHDFSPDAFAHNGMARNSKLKTGLRTFEGWKGFFLDESAPHELLTDPPKNLKTSIEDLCKKGLKQPIVNCSVAWYSNTSFQ